MSTSGGQAGGGLLGQIRIEDGTAGTLAVVRQPASGLAPPNALATLAILEARNGSTGNTDLVRLASAVDLAGTTAVGTLFVAEPGSWSVVSGPAPGSLASASRAAGAAGVRHVATGMLISAGSVVAPVLTLLTVNLRDGASSAGTILASIDVVITAAVGQNVPPFYVPLPNPVGSAATAMTLEFGGALANLSQSVTLFGFDAV